MRPKKRCGQPFYIGKGNGDRAKTHLYETKENNENIFKFNKIQKIRKDGFEPFIKYHTKDISENDAYDLEAQLIKEYGRKIDGGILTNICLDNRPPDLTGRPVSEQTKQKIGDAQRGELNHRYGVKWSEEQKKLRSNINKLNGNKPPVRTGPMSQEQKDAISRGNTGKKRTKEQSEYLSSIRNGKTRQPWSEETKQKIRLGNNPNIITPEIGMEFGLWRVIEFSHRDADKRGSEGIFWLCQCSCAKQTIKPVCQRNLARGLSKSCCKKRKKNANS